MTYGKRPPLDEEKALFESQVAREGVTTGAGAPAGNSFFDAALIGFGANSFVSMLAVVYPGQPNLVDSFDISAFDDTTGEVTLSHNYKGGQIPAGVPYKIVTFRFVPAEVAAIAAALAAHEAAQLASRGEVTSIETKVDAVEVKLDTPANFMADVSALALEASLGTHDTDIKALLAAIAGYIDNEVALIKAQTDKLAGAAPGVGTTTENWNAAEADIVSIGANDTKSKLHSLLLSIHNLVGTIVTVRMYMEVNGTERKVYDQDFDATTDPPGLWIVNGTVGIHEVLRVTLESNNAADDAKAVHYDYMLEVQ